MTGLEIQEAAFRIVGEALDQGWELAKSNFPGEVKTGKEIPVDGLGWDFCDQETWLQLHISQDGQLNVREVLNRSEPMTWSVIPFSTLSIDEKMNVLYTVGRASEALST